MRDEGKVGVNGLVGSITITHSEAESKVRIQKLTQSNVGET
jgi:hypothetical protein